MKTFSTPLQLPKDRQTCVTIGNFDGVHRGHAKLIRRMVAVGRERGLGCVVITFSPHPRAFFSGNPMPPLISAEERRARIEGLGADALIELEFNRELASLSPKEFLQRYVYPMNLKALVVGYDFRLGKGRSGDFEVLKAIGEQDGFTAEKVDPLMYGNEPVSSTRLRKSIQNGDMALTAAMFGHAYGFSGEVIHGDGRGSAIGFPTANLAVPAVQLPPDGVYATRVRHAGKLHPSVTNIGFRPTFNGEGRTIESFLLDCDVNLYAKTINLEFLGRLRDEKRFNSADELVKQIAKDVEGARSFYNTAIF